jgi:hypothetical protein
VGQPDGARNIAMGRSLALANHTSDNRGPVVGSEMITLSMKPQWARTRQNKALNFLLVISYSTPQKCEMICHPINGYSAI